jgi:hypothetical protein
MPGRYFVNRLPDWGGAPVVLDAFGQLAAQSFRDVLQSVLSQGPAGHKPSAYTGKLGQAGAGRRGGEVQAVALLADCVQSLAAAGAILLQAPLALPMRCGTPTERPPH